MRPLIRLELINVCAVVGNGVTAIALPWFVLERTGSAAATGLVAASNTLPLLISAVFAGTVVDRCGPRRASLWSDALSSSSMVAVLLVSTVDAPPVLVVALLAAVGSAFDQVGVTARAVLLPAVARTAGQEQRRVNSIHEATAAVAATVGPGAAGVLIGGLGVNGAFVVGAALPLVAMVAMARLRTAEPATEPLQTLGRAAAPSLRSSVAHGFAVVWCDPLLRLLLLLSALFFAISSPVQGIVLPKYFLEQRAPEYLGLVVVGMSGGGVLGAMAYGQWGARVRQWTVFVTAIVGTNVAFLLMAPLPDVPVLLVLATLTGVVAGPLTPMFHLAVQRRVAEANLGRAIGAFVAAGSAAAPLGLIAGGFSVEHVGVQRTFMISAVAFVIITVVTIFARTLRGLDEPQAADARKGAL